MWSLPVRFFDQHFYRFLIFPMRGTCIHTITRILNAEYWMQNDHARCQLLSPGRQHSDTITHLATILTQWNTVHIPTTHFPAVSFNIIFGSRFGFASRPFLRGSRVKFLQTFMASLVHILNTVTTQKQDTDCGASLTVTGFYLGSLGSSVSTVTRLRVIPPAFNSWKGQ
jgi:hypothetical protein